MRKTHSKIPHFAGQVLHVSYATCSNTNHVLKPCHALFSKVSELITPKRCASRSVRETKELLQVYDKVPKIHKYSCVIDSHFIVSFKLGFFKSNLHYTRGITPKRKTSGGAHLRGLAPGQHSSEETLQRWRAVGDTADLTGPGIEPQTFFSTRPIAA